MPINLDNLNENAVLELADTILKGLRDYFENNLKDEPDATKYLLESLVPVLDELDEDDFFGSEGWEHYFGWGN